MQIPVVAQLKKDTFHIYLKKTNEGNIRKRTKFSRDE